MKTTPLKVTRSYGWKPDLPDGRDKLMLVERPPHAIPLSMDLRPAMPLVRDQGRLGCCTGFAVAGCIGYYALKKAPLTFSPLFIYYQERVIEKTVKQDAGAEIRDGVKALKKAGACLEELWPYKVSKYRVPPPPASVTDAYGRRIKAYTRVPDLLGMREALANGNPVVMGFTVYESFESEDVAKTGIMPMPDLKTERLLGGHAVLAVGYDHQHERVLIRNSWGAEWGIGGYFWMPYAYLTNRNLSDDFWYLTP